MANTVKLKISVSDDGSLNIVAKEAKNAAAATDKLGASTDKLNKSRGKYHRGEKGVAGATANSTKAFSKQRDLIGGGSSGLVGAYATLAANVFALTAAFGVLSRSSGVDQMSKSLEFLGNAAGTNLDIVVNRLQRVTDGALSAEQALRSASIGTSAGFSTDELEALTKVARGAATALDRDLADAQDRLVRGVAKLEPEILDELGILVRLDAAAEAYGSAIGKTANQLTEGERRQAFLNATLDQGAKKYGDLAENIDVNAYDKLAASLSNLLKSFTQLLNKALVPFIELIADNQVAMGGFAALFLSTISGTLLPAIAQSGQAMADNAADNSKFAQANLKNLKSVSKGTTVYGKFIAGLKDGSTSVDDYRKGLNSLDDSIGKYGRSLEKVRVSHGKESTQYKTKKALLNSVTVERTKLITAVQAHQTASAKMTAATALENLSQGRLVIGYKALIASIIEYRASLVVAGTQTSIFTTLLNLLKTGAFATGLGIRALGAALFSLLGPIAAAISIGSLLYSFFKEKFFPEDETKEKVSEVVQALENIKNVNQQFVESMKEGSDRTIAGLTAMSGVLAQNIQLIRARAIAQRQSGAQELQDNAGALKAAQDRVAAAEALVAATPASRRNRGNLGYTEAVKELNEATAAFKKLNDQQVKAFIASRTISQETRNSVKALAAELKGSAIGDFAPGIVTSLEELSGAFRSSEGSARFLERLKALQEEAETTTSFINDLPSALQEFDKQQAKLGARSQTPFDGLLEGAMAVQAEFKNLDNVSETTRQTLLDNLEAVVGKDLAETFGSNPGGAAAAVDVFVANLTKAVATLSEVQSKTKANATLQKSLAFAATQTGEGFDKLLEAQRASITIRREAIEAEQTILAEQTNLGEEEKKRQEAVLQNKTDALLLDESALDTNVKRVEKSIMLTKNLQAQSKLMDKAAQTLNKTALLENEILKTNMRLANAKDPSKSSSALTPVQELAAAKELAKTAEERANREFESKKRNANLTATMTHLEFELIKAKLEAQKLLDADRLKQITDAQNLIGITRDGIIKNAGLERDLAVKNSELTVSDARDKAMNFGQYTGSNSFETVSNLFEPSKEGKEDSAADVAFADDGKLQDKINFMKAATQQMSDELKKLGPEGELISTVTEGAFTIASSFTTAFNTAGDGMKKAGAIAQAVGDSIGAINAMMQASARASIAKMDDQIAAEKKRDGKSAESVAKINAMEKKKEAVKKKAFETNKKMMIAQAIANTAAAIMATAASNMGAPWAIPMMAMMGALGAAQVAVIAGTSYQGGGSAAAASGPTSISMGSRNNTVDLATSRSSSGEIAYMRGEEGSGQAETFRPAFSGYKNRAEGGNTGLIVGEQGPELFVPQIPGRVVPNDDMLAGAPTNVSFNINAIDASGVEDMLVAQRGNIIGMIRQAANSYGQDFVEEVDTSTYTPSAGGVSRY